MGEKYHRISSSLYELPSKLLKRGGHIGDYIRTTIGAILAQEKPLARFFDVLLGCDVTCAGTTFCDLPSYSDGH